jgi:hypothetical protein
MMRRKSKEWKSMADLAPIALFGYRRPHHIARAVESLRGNPEAARSNLFVFCDGPRDEKDAPDSEAVRRFARKISGFRSVTVVERPTNFGLSRSITDGVSKLCAELGRIIVVEDDLIVSPHFLGFMNSALAAYAGEEQVAAVGGYMFPTHEPLPELFLFRVPDCLGWATWKRAWDLYRPDGRALLNEIRRSRIEREFDLGGAYPYTRMLAGQVRGRNDSWAVRWYASLFLAGHLTLYPGRSLTAHTGWDGTGRHCGVRDVPDESPTTEPIAVQRIPIGEDRHALAAIARHLRETRPSLATRAIGRLRAWWKQR